MNSLSVYILEKLRINKDTKVSSDFPLIDKAKNIDPNEKYSLKGTFAWPERKDIEKMEGYKNKGSKPERLVNSIKDNEKLERRFVVACRFKWEEAIQVFGQALIDRNIRPEKDVVLCIKEKYIKTLENK